MKLFIYTIIALLPFLGQKDPGKIILFYGDSLTAGYGLAPEQAFPAIIGRELNSTGEQYKIINAGLSGETSAGGLNRLDWILREPVDVFVLELGANDGLRGLPLEQTEKNLQQIIDKVKTKYPQTTIVIAGMMVPPNLGEEYSEQFRSIFPKLARQNKALLVPFLLEGVAGDESLNLPDGIHPNTDGHEIVANNVLKVIVPVLNTKN